MHRQNVTPPESYLLLVNGVFCRFVDEGVGSAHSVTDGWKLGLLDILCLDFYFTVAQVIQVQPYSLLYC